MNEGMLGKGIAVVIAAAVVLSLLFGFVAEALTQLLCGARPAAVNLFSGLWLAVTGDPPRMSHQGGARCRRPDPGRRVLAVLVVAGLAIWILVLVRRYRESDQSFIADLRTRPGFATSSEIREHLSAKAVLRRASQLRPDIAHPAPTDVGWRVGRSRKTDVYVSIEDSVALEGPPRSGKGYRVLISAIVDWSGPLITTSTTNDNLTATMRMRQQRGDVYVFDPQGLSGIRHPMRVNPIIGCEDPLVAMQRGAAIITGTALGASSTNGEWAQASGVVLGRLLHAAAVGNQSIEAVYDWGTSPAQARDAVDILRAAGAPGWGNNLESTISGDEKLVSSIWFGVQGAVAPLAVPQIRDALMQGPGIPCSTRASSSTGPTPSTSSGPHRGHRRWAGGWARCWMTSSRWPAPARSRAPGPGSPTRWG